MITHKKVKDKESALFKKILFQKKAPLLWLVLSFVLVAFAQPDLSLVCCILSATIGYALFWKGLSFFESKKEKFFLALFWFGALSLIHLSWFASDQYVGGFIYVVLGGLCLTLGLFFATFSLFIKKNQTLLTLLGLSSLWTLVEWSRLFFLSGFSFDPLGLSLTATLYGLQMASLGGIYTLTFWVIFCNLLAFKVLCSPCRKSIALFGLASLLPYVYGGYHLMLHEKRMEKDQEKLSALLIQPSLYPEEKVRFPFSIKLPLTPLEQWKHLLQLIKKHEGKKIDLILFPEAVVPYGTHYPLFPSSVFEKTFAEFFYEPKKKSGNVGNSAFAGALADALDADVVIGLEDSDALHVYNSALIFHPHEVHPQRYEKRVLVPMGEYIPFEWCKRILARYGIQDSFTRGAEAKVFRGKKVSFGISICYEETYGHMMRENRQKGAELLLNLTNDVWYPKSRLPMVHYLHSRLRAVEQGIPLLRATNTGVTVGVDSLGRVKGMLPYETSQKNAPADALYVQVPTYTYPTLYTLTGDSGIIYLSCLFLFLNSLDLFKVFVSKTLNSLFLRKNKN